MNREIKFRAWHKTKKIMGEVFQIDYECNGVWVKFHNPDMDMDEAAFWEFGEIDLEQSIGHEGEIYQGDIVECYYGENLRDEGKFRGEVVWDDRRLRYKIVEIRPYKWGDSEVAGEIINFEDAIEIEIVGTIHDTPEPKEKP